MAPGLSSQQGRRVHGTGESGGQSGRSQNQGQAPPSEASPIDSVWLSPHALQTPPKTVPVAEEHGGQRRGRLTIHTVRTSSGTSLGFVCFSKYKENCVLTPSLFLHKT